MNDLYINKAFSATHSKPRPWCYFLDRFVSLADVSALMFAVMIKSWQVVAHNG